MRHLHGAFEAGVERLQAGHDLAGGEDLDPEPVVGEVGHHLRHHVGAP